MRPRSLVDVEQRRAAMEKVEKILQDDAVIVQPLWQPKFFSASEKVKDMNAHPAQDHLFQRVWMEALRLPQARAGTMAGVSGAGASGAR